MVNSSDAFLAASLAKLWPNREHESNALKALFCACNAHRWRELNVKHFCPDKDVQFCFWCSKVPIDGVVYPV